MFLGRTWQQVAPGMIINAFASIYMPALNAIIAESLPFDRRGAAFGAYRTITSSPQIFMPVISGIYVDIFGITSGVRLGLIMFTLVGITASITRTLFLRETLIKNNPQKTTIVKHSYRETRSSIIQSFTRSPVLLFMIFIPFFVTSFNFSLINSLPVKPNG